MTRSTWDMTGSANFAAPRAPLKTALFHDNGPLSPALHGFAAQAGLDLAVTMPLGALADMTDAAAADLAACQLAMVHICSKPERELHDLARHLVQNAWEAVVWTDLQWLDHVYAGLAGASCQFLVEPHAADGIIAMTSAMTGAVTRAMQQQSLHAFRDGGRAAAPDMLNSISHELARFADRLAQMARQQDAATSHGAFEGSRTYRPGPVAGPQGFTPFAKDKADDIEAGDIREMIRLRRLRDQIFQPDLFADPAWDILLDLMAARLEHRLVSVSSLCIAAAVPPTTALRWIKSMTDMGLLVRRADPMDARRVHITLSDETADRMADYLRADLASRSRN